MIFAVVGPTCSGKSKIAIEIAKLFNAEIINFDPYQCYRQLNIGVAKPTFEELNIVPHHLFNIVNVDEKFTIFDFQKVFRNKLNELISNNKNVVLVGGSGLYLRSSVYDYELSEQKNEGSAMNFDEFSNEQLFEMLKKVDLETSKKIHINNRKRLIRALEIYFETGEKKSDIEKRQEHKLLYDINFIGISPERNYLYDLINKRVDIMFENGLIEEVENLFKRYDSNLQSLQAIGYKEFRNLQDIDEIKELIKKNTRNYAKRQITFFKHQFNDIKWFNNINEVMEHIKNEY